MKEATAAISHSFLKSDRFTDPTDSGNPDIANISSVVLHVSQMDNHSPLL